jgi:hypothetical protein
MGSVCAVRTRRRGVRTWKGPGVSKARAAAAPAVAERPRLSQGLATRPSHSGFRARWGSQVGRQRHVGHGDQLREHTQPAAVVAAPCPALVSMWGGARRCFGWRQKKHKARPEWWVVRRSRRRLEITIYDRNSAPRSFLLSASPPRPSHATHPFLIGDVWRGRGAQQPCLLGWGARQSSTREKAPAPLRRHGRRPC